MSIETVREALNQLGLADRLIEPPVSTATVPEAARALGLKPGQIAKTLSLRDGEGAMLLLMAGDCRIDNHRFKERFSMKARMLSADEALAFTGHAVGGVCPFALKNPLPVYLDESLLAYDTVYPAGGSPRSAVRLSPDELFSAAHALAWVSVSAAPQNAETDEKERV